MGIGFGFHNDFNSASFSVFDLNIHYHSSHDESPCPFRFGFEIGLMGFHMSFGLFS